ncbi:daptide biosynthesis intramembrane metalloprotease, partial [Streptomyces scabiei]
SSPAGAVLLAPERLARPRLAPDVVVHEPAEPGAPWVVQRGSHQYFRLQEDLARLVRAVDGVRGHDDLAEALGAPWTRADVGSAVRTLAGAKVLDDGVPKKNRGSWFRFVPPLTLQFTLLKPDRMLARLAPLVAAAAHRGAAVAASAVAIGGLLALAFRADGLQSALGRPFEPLLYLCVIGAVLATTAVHEIGHGAVLTYHGGRPTRMGMMLFYMSPAFFCDVSDGWRLPRKEQRVGVALAGIATQTVIAGAAALATLFLGDSAARDGILVYAVVTYLSGVLNLLPFVKLDGYIALMSHLDIPHLRDRAMTDARRWLARLLAGGTGYRRELPGVRWAVPFGLLCMTFPLYIVAGAITLWSDSLQRLGALGALLVLCGIGYFLHHLARGVRRFAREARTAGGRPLRLGAVLTLAAAAVAVLGQLVQVPYTVNGGYTTAEDGRITLLLPLSTDRALITSGAPVRLYRAGIATRAQTGTATVAVDGADGTDAMAPLSALIPVRSEALPTPALGLPLEIRDGRDRTPADRSGAAQLDAGSRPGWEWLYTKYVAPAWRW